MKTLKIIISLLPLIYCYSCAHKSGHNKINKGPRNSVVESTTTESEINSAKVVEKENLSFSESPPNETKNKLEGAQVFSKYNTAVFMVFTSDGFNVYQGSGFFINSHGLAVSNYHVFQGTSIGEEGIKLAGSDVVYKVVEVIKSSEEEDFILFRVNASNTNFIPMAKFKPQVGEKVFAIGSPLGLENTFSSGEVSQWRDKNLMQISALIDHGSSGGLLLMNMGS